ncbi:MAG: biotin/lipoyl-binding protein [Hyphomicrobiaceae bacterium]
MRPPPDMSPGLPADEVLELPALRPELSIIRGSSSRAGEAGWLIYDPVQHRYFQIDQASYELLSVWPACSDADALAEAAETRFGLKVGQGQIQEFIEFVHQNCLVVDPGQADWRHYAELMSRQDQSKSPLTSLAHNYLFFRIPLMRPQRMLSATMPLVSPFYSRTCAAIVILLGMAGLYLTSRQWDDFTRTADFLFSWEGAVSFGLALVFVKMLHELGHAYTAVRYGCFVSTIGVAFMLLTPMLYTDVTDSWKLRSRKKRLAIDSAGIVVELGVACVATFLWVFLPDGPVRSVAFMMATAGWIMSLVINLNPFMRFDGYYLMSELIGVENLQSRAFAIGRWRMREVLFGLGLPCPEQQLSRRMVNGLTFWAWGTWLYRLALFIGIAVLVYTYCFKILGVLLFVLEIVFLVARPVWSELKEWYAMRKLIASSRRSAATALCLAALIALVTIPWSGNVQIPAVIQAAKSQPIHAPQAALLTKVHVSVGQKVKKGQLLFSLTSGDLDNQLELVDTELALVRLRLARRNVDEIDREDSLVLEQRLHALQSKRAGLMDQRRELVLLSPMSGHVLELQPTVHAGRWIKPTEELAIVGQTAVLEASGYVQEDDVWRVTVGSTGRFIPDTPLAPAINVELTEVAIASSTNLDMLSLTSTYGGPISVEPEADKTLVPTRAQYLAKLAITEPLAHHRSRVRGMVSIAGQPESLIARVWRRTLNVLVRESGA